MKLKESIKRKLSIAIVVVMMVSFMFAKTVSAKTFLQAAGGKLMEPVLNFAMFIGDAIENALDGSLYDKANRPYVVREYNGEFYLSTGRTRAIKHIDADSAIID